jgi:hypothetical protein
MTELAPPLIEADPAQIPPMAAERLVTSNSTSK